MHIKWKGVLFTFFLFICLPITALAGSDSNYGLNYNSYIYDGQGNPVAVPPAYEYENSITGTDVSDEEFRNLEDVKYDGAGRIYFADSGNARVVVATSRLDPVTVIDSYVEGGEEKEFVNPCAVEVQGDSLYIADSEAGKIIRIHTNTFETLAVYNRPSIPALGENYVYQPIDVAVDDAGYLYVIARDINQGLILVDAQGSFSSFLGAPEVSLKWNEILVRKLLPKRLWGQLGKNVPTEYNSVFINNKGFLYVTSQSADISPIARLNAQGENILKYKDEAPCGDGIYLDKDGSPVVSRFVDIVSSDNGMYFALDSARGRIFGYDEDGRLLYIFGHTGSQKDAVYAPTALELMDGKILVTDKTRNACLVFSQTSVGRNIDLAMTYHKSGEYDKERDMWLRVTAENSNYDIATIYLARLDIREGNYQEALIKLSSVQEKEYYAIALQSYRSQWLEQNAVWLALIVLVLAGGVIAIRLVLKKAVWVQRLKATALYGELTYSKYMIFHPFNGFWDMKREKRGSMRGATILFVLFSFWVIIRARFTAYLFMEQDAGSVNALFEWLTMVVPLLLWIIANWCFTTLMDGEGSMWDIYMATGYALTPYVIFSPLLLTVSYFLAGEETVFYTYADVLVWLWVLALIVIGMAVVHDYSVSKTVLVVVLTILGMATILFVVLLVGNLVQEIYNYFHNIYEEIAFRLY